ncbi:MAG: GreA/GreB family elongation factor [Caldilineaceae bacterium]|nr:GreA/GreB family elongation factor [Caldilineaceae bacterium]
MEETRQGAEEQARLGARVVVELLDGQGQRERMSFDIVREEHADFDQGRLGRQTPLAKALIGKRVGALVPYVMGDIRQVRILSVHPSLPATLENSTEARQAQLQKALDTVERTNAEIFAASYTGKWGDYELADDTQ